MRILMLQNGMPPYWIARLRAICAMRPDVEITLATNSGGDVGRPDEAFADLPVRWAPLSTKPLEAVNFPLLVPKTIATIRALMPDVAYLAGIMHSNFIAAHVLCRMLGIPIIGSSISTDFDARSGAGLVRSAKEELKRGLLSLVDVMMVPGQRAYEHMRRFGMDDARLVRAGHASATPEYREKSLALSDAELAQELSGLGLPEAGYLLFVGRFSWVKNIPRMLRAYAKARSLREMPPLVLAGDGADKGEIEGLIRDLDLQGHVVMPGYLNSSQLLYAFSGAKAFLLPSVSETWGMVVNEAMACGTPCIVSDRAGCAPDLIEHGETGWLIDPESEASITAAMLASVSDRTPADVVRERLWQKVQHHSPQRFAETFHHACDLARFRHGRTGGIA